MLFQTLILYGVSANVNIQAYNKKKGKKGGDKGRKLLEFLKRKKRLKISPWVDEMKRAGLTGGKNESIEKRI